MHDAADVCVIGLGRVGLPLAVTLAERGLRVVGVDHHAAHLARLRRGRLPFAEPGLQTALCCALLAGGLALAPAPVAATSFIIAVGTPLRRRRADLRALQAALQAVAPLLAPGALVVIESTVPPGTTAAVAAQLHRLRPELRIPGDVAVAHCPERVLPGAALREITANPRLVGGLTPACTDQAAALYACIADGGLERTQASSAELAKLAENSFRDVNIAFANELAAICAAHGADARQVIALANRHPRVDILQPGPGVGGHCLAVDPWFLAQGQPQARLIRAARRVNDAQPARLVREARAATAGISWPVVACLGLAYKRDVDDLRASPALAVVRQLVREGWATVLPVEPHLQAAPPCLARLGLRLHGLEEALARADLVLLLVDHSAFQRPTREQLRGRRLIDTRGTWDRTSLPARRRIGMASDPTHRLPTR